MGTPFELLPSFSFGGIRIPMTEWNKDLDNRDHVHEYPHQDGGDPEKLGRRLHVYTVKLMFDVWFHNKGYPDLWPDRLVALQDLVERQQTREMVHPTWGTVICYPLKCRVVGSAEVQSGELAELTLREEKPIAIDVLMGPTLARLDGLDFNLKQAVLLKTGSGTLGTDAISLFDALGNAIRKVARVKDSVDLFGSKIEAYTQQALDLCNVIDGLTDLGNPENNPVVQPFHDLWFGLTRFSEDIARKRQSLSRITTSVDMSVNDLAVQLYNSTDRINELLAMNAFESALLIPAGTQVRFYPP